MIYLGVFFNVNFKINIKYKATCESARRNIEQKNSKPIYNSLKVAKTGIFLNWKRL
jgi:hypothetical protein